MPVLDDKQTPVFSTAPSAFGNGLKAISYGGQSPNAEAVPHRGGFPNGPGPLYCNWWARASRWRNAFGKTLCPSKNGSSPVLNDGSNAICPRPPTMGCRMANRPSFKQAGPSDVPICQKRTKGPYQDGARARYGNQTRPISKRVLEFSKTGRPNMYWPVRETPYGHEMTHSVK
jgi:hypothetical protein